MKLKSEGIVMIDSILGFISIVVCISLLSAYTYQKYLSLNVEYSDFKRYLEINNIFYKEGVDYRYDDMFERVLSY